MSLPGLFGPISEAVFLNDDTSAGDDGNTYLLVDGVAVGVGDNLSLQIADEETSLSGCAYGTTHNLNDEGDDGHQGDEGLQNASTQACSNSFVPIAAGVDAITATYGRVITVVGTEIRVHGLDPVDNSRHDPSQFKKIYDVGLEMESGSDYSIGTLQTSSSDAQAVPMAIVANYGKACVIYGEDRKVKCMGRNSWGDLGFGYRSDYEAEFQELQLDGAPASGVRQVVFTKESTCVLQSNTAYCVGRNNFGQLGASGLDQSDEGSVTLEPVQLNGVIELAAGDAHVCALVFHYESQTKRVACWGAGERGQNASDFFVNTKYAVSVLKDDGTPLVAERLAAAGNTSCAVTKEGHVYCWGDNSSGQTGSGHIALGGCDQNVNAYGCRNASALPMRGVDFGAMQFDGAKIIMGARHTCVDSKNGTYCTGDNSRGQTAQGPGTKATFVAVRSR